MKQATKSNPESDTTPRCLPLVSFISTRLRSSLGERINRAMPSNVIGIKSRARSRHAPTKWRLPAEPKSRVASTMKPTISLSSARIRSCIGLWCVQKRIVGCYKTLKATWRLPLVLVPEGI